MLFCVSAQNSITVTGTVRDKLTHPVEGITVAYQCDGTDVILPVQTDESGYFEFSFEQLGIDENTLPATINLGANYPNPFNPGTVIPLTTNTPGQFLIHDLLGRRVQSIQITHAGHFTLAWGGMLNSGLPAPAGIYFYSFQTVESRLTGKMILLDGGGNTGLSLTGDNKTKQQEQPKQRTECENYTLSYSAEHITDITIDLGETGYTEDTEIAQEVNIAPHGTDQSYSVHIGDTLLIDLNDVIDNDSPTVFEIEENNHFIELESDILQYIPNEPETFSIEVTAIDSMDTALMDTIIITAQAVYWDTTSHVFTWEIDMLGYHLSYLQDVAIVDENDIWAVGTITEEPNSPNFVRNAHWDGEEWDFFNVISGAEKITLFAFAHDDIWMTSSLPMHFNGNEWHVFTPDDDGYPIGAGWLISIWGSSSEDMYFGGSYGYIIHYDGETFTALDSPTNDTPIDIERISGSADGEYVFAIGNGIIDSELHSIILIIENGQVDTLYHNIGVIPTEGNMGAIYDDGLDVFGGIAYFSTKAGIWKYNYLTGDSTIVEEFTGELGTRGMEVQADNDISIFLSGSVFLHFNGYDWRLDNTLYNQLGLMHTSYGMDFKDNLVISVGVINAGAQAYAARGYRNPGQRKLINNQNEKKENAHE